METECMVCYESIQKKYVIRGCNHIMCFTCASILRQLPESKELSDIEFPSTLPFPIKIPGIKSRIKCPMCRQIEPGIKLSTFEQKHPIEYDKFIQLVLNQCSDGSSYFMTSKLLWSPPLQKTKYAYLYKPKLIKNGSLK